MYSVKWSLLDQDGNNVTSWEIIFIVFATAFALEEYTASKEHGWISKSFTVTFYDVLPDLT